jgi:hypothetical protein
MARKEARRVKASWRQLRRRGDTEATADAICRQAKAAGQIAACDVDNLVLVDRDGLRLVARNDSGHFDQATADRVLKALRAPADY